VVSNDCRIFWVLLVMRKRVMSDYVRGARHQWAAPGEPFALGGRLGTHASMQIADLSKRMRTLCRTPAAAGRGCESAERHPAEHLLQNLTRSKELGVPCQKPASHESSPVG